jgi:molecular chaperone DnaK
LDKVMLVGGATRTPFVQELLMQKLGIEPRHEINPDLVVAMGAAIQGAALAGQPAPAILIDISAHTYSVMALANQGLMDGDLVCCPVVRRGTALPVTKGELFTTTHDNQVAVQIDVYQGESDLPEENLRIGEFRIEGLSKVPGGNEIIVQFRIDLSGLLTATATEKRTGLVKSVTIDTAGQHRINLDAARTNLAALFDEQESAGESFLPDDEDDADDAIEIDEIDDSASLLTSAKSLRSRARKLLDQGVAESDAAAIHAILAEVAPAIEARNWQALRKSLDTLSDLLFYLDD